MYSGSTKDEITYLKLSARIDEVLNDRGPNESVVRNTQHQQRQSNVLASDSHTARDYSGGVDYPGADVDYDYD
jgi:hypothetical protein